MKRPRNTFLSSVLCLALAGLYGCQAAAQGRRMFGAGTISCAEWQKYRTNDEKAHRFQAQAWVDGYLSGYNVGMVGADFLESQPSSIALYAWIDNYCAINPLDLLASATSELRKELSGRAGR